MITGILLWTLSVLFAGYGATWVRKGCDNKNEKKLFQGCLALVGCGIIFTVGVFEVFK